MCQTWIFDGKNVLEEGAYPEGAKLPVSATLQCLFPVLQHSFVLLKNKMSTHIILTNICSLLYDCLALKQSAPVG